MSINWHYSGRNIEVVKEFDYVGVHFTSQLSMYELAEHMSVKAKRVFLYISSFV
jgi:predicted DNA-binding protein YlxM (UPF0122 family)